MENKRAGYIVETEKGETGRTYHDEPLVNGKTRVYLDDGKKLLCDAGKLKLKGFID